METSIKQLSKIISEDIVLQLKDIKAEVLSCSLKAKETEEFVTSKMQYLERENNILRRQMNRSDIIIFGLSENLTVDEMYAEVFDVAKYLNVDIVHADVNLCVYIRQKKSVLVKFNSLYKRDLLMKHYFAAGEIKRCQVFKTDIQSRIYFNDNLTPMAMKLVFFCRKLRKEGKIMKFRFYNKDIPEAKIYLPGGSSKLLNFEKMYLMYKNNTIEEESNTISVAEK